MKKKTQTIKKKLLAFFLFGMVNAGLAQNLIEPMDTGKFSPTWESLKQYSSAPDWFRDAKFGIWAHWGPQVQPEQGDWFARFMYYPGSQRNWFTSTYGTATNLGFKEVINSWKAQSWNPDSIVKIYKNAGAMYFFAMGNHHDNLDMWDSKYQEWNTVRVGPKKDILDGWEKAARNNNLKFGVSIHASHAWNWLEPSQSYDGNLTKADGTGKWWEGLDPQELYAQNHAHSSGWDNSGTIHSQWNWVNGASIPSEAYCNKFYNRTMEMIKKFNPDLIYFDDTSLPFVAVDNSGNRSTTTVSDVGLKIAASYYNKGANSNGGKVNNVIFGKILTKDEKECLVWDVERGIPDKPQEKPWQTCTCIGDWHYNRSVYNENRYKSAKTVIHMLVDIVSKNGNLLLNVPLRGDGTYDEKELAVVQGITAWMNVNKTSIYGTRPWTKFGEGPTAERANALNAQGFNEGTYYDAGDIRYVKKGDSLLYATVMGWPTNGSVTLKSLASGTPYLISTIKSLKLVGGSTLSYTRNAQGLIVNLPTVKPGTADIGIVFEIALDTVVSVASLQEFIKQAEIADSVAELNVGTGTGQNSSAAIAIFETAIAEAKAISGANTDVEIKDATLKLQKAFIAFLGTVKNMGGIIEYPYSQNITTKYLEEARIFSRADAIKSLRFGAPKYWSADFNIPQNDGSGTKQGIDKYPQYNTLMLGVWDDVGRSAKDAKNARLYKKVTLPAGRYFFGANYETLYAISKVYLFVSKTIPTTANVETSSIAYHLIGSDKVDASVYGLEFSLSTETEIYLGWVGDLTTTARQEFRAKEVVLLKVLSSADYDPTNAISAPDSTGILLYMSQFSRVYNNSGTYSIARDTGYLVGASGQSLELGIVDFGINKYNKVYVNTASDKTIAAGASYNLYLDSETTPFATIPVVKTSSAIDFIKAESTIGQISGVHKVTLKFNNHTSSLLSIGLENTNITSVKTDRPMNLYKVYSTNNTIFVDRLNKNNVAVYSITGSLINMKTTATGKVEFHVKDGLYLLVIDGKAMKIIV